MKLSKILKLLLVVCPFFMGSTYSMEDENKKLRQGYEKDVSKWTKKIKDDSKNPIYYCWRGKAYFQLEQYVKAEKDLTKTIEMEPKEDIQDFYFFRASIYVKLEQYDKADKDLTEVITLNPKNPIYYLCRGDVYSQLKQYDKAEKDFTTAITLDSKNPSYYKRRGNLYFGQAQYSLAEKDLMMAKKLNPENFKHDKIFVSLLLKSKERLQKIFSKEILSWTTKIKDNSDIAIYYNNRALAYCKLNKYSEAEKDFTTAIMLEPKNPIYYGRRALPLLKLGKSILAQKDLMVAGKLDPENFKMENFFQFY